MHHRPTLLSILTASLLALSTLTANAAQLDPVEQNVWGDTIEFQTSGKFEILTLTVGVPDGTAIRTAVQSSSVSLSSIDGAGEHLPDGIYSYELEGAGATGESVLLRSGYFSVAGGAFVSPEPLEDPAGLEKASFSENLSVIGSLCVGVDCTANESFGFHTIRMRENNLNVMFDDTSSAGEFPRNDWMLRINESANGGADLFSIVNCAELGSGCGPGTGTAPFTILASAPENSIFVGAQGNLGLGTSTPARELQIKDGDSPGLRLQQDATSGFVEQSWDIAANEVEFFVQDVTGLAKPFKIKTGAPNESLVLDANGDLAVYGTVDGRDLAADGATLDAHVADLANPHQVTAAQVGADPAGTAAAAAATAIAAHEASYDHSTLPSALPVPISQGGTGATDAATARANLGIADDTEKAGIAAAADFAGNPATATVVFSTPFPPGTQYAVSLTAMTGNARKTASPNLIAKDETGFTISLGGQVGDVVEVDWQARPVD